MIEDTHLVHPKYPYQNFRDCIADDDIVGDHCCNIKNVFLHIDKKKKVHLVECCCIPMNG